MAGVAGRGIELNVVNDVVDRVDNLQKVSTGQRQRIVCGIGQVGEIDRIAVYEVHNGAGDAPGGAEIELAADTGETQHAASGDRTGDELPLITDIASLLPQMLNSPLSYPEALAELWMGDHKVDLDILRDHYLKRAQQLGAVELGARWFTDKMPLNETHLGLIALLFPQSPLIHVVRHPLDVVLSTFSNSLTHGFLCATGLQSAARHYVLVVDSVEHYRSEMALRYLPVRYENIVDDQEHSVRRMLDFIGAPFDDACLRFHENRRYARTASYAQVTETLYNRSRYRHRHYRKQLEPLVELLGPVIGRLGYEVAWAEPA